MENEFNYESLLDSKQSNETVTEPIKDQNQDIKESVDTKKTNENEPEESVIYSFLKSKGITDPSKTQFENEKGETEEIDFNSLSKEEQLNILSSITDSDLSDEEKNTINYLRENGVTLNQAIDYFSKKALTDYLNEHPDQKHAKTYSIDDYSDDDLYLADLKTKYPSFSDEELVAKLNNAKSEETLYKKEIDQLRDAYKKAEEESIAESENREKQDYEDLKNNLGVAVSNFNEISLDSSDPESDSLEIEPEDKRQMLSYLLDQDSDGKSQFIKDVEDPNSLIKLAWYKTQGDAVLSNVTQYWKGVLKEERKERAKLEKELETLKNKGQNTVVDKQKNNENIKTPSSLFDNTGLI